jgi:MoaA/NifB/PqqE/SkfB family radical SAM enzyme
MQSAEGHPAQTTGRRPIPTGIADAPDFSLPGPITPTIYTGWKRVPVGLRALATFTKYILQRKKYPRFRFRLSRGGVIKTLELRSLLSVKKAVRFNNSYFLSLNMPHFPSKPFDNTAANGGLNVAMPGSAANTHCDYVVLALTRKCNLRCKHCYERFNLYQKDTVPIERWKQVIKSIQQRGVSNIVLSGGEPMLRYDMVLELLESSDKSLSDFHIHTSGDHVTWEKALALKKAGLTAAAVALDDVDPEGHDNFRGRRGTFDQAVKALKYFNRAGLFTYVNTVVSKDLLQSGGLWKLYDLVKELNAGIFQIIEPRAAGAYLSKNIDTLFSHDDRQALVDFYIKGNTDKKYRDYPLIYYPSYLERSKHVGCRMGDLSHFTIDSSGNVNPCVFLPISFGNIMEEDVQDICRRMRRATPHTLQKKCPSLYLAKAINSKIEQGFGPPVPYSEIKEEFQRMYASNSQEMEWGEKRFFTALMRSINDKARGRRRTPPEA